MDTGEVIHEYGNFKGGVVKLASAGLSIVALLMECIQVWDCVGGDAMYRISLVHYIDVTVKKLCSVML